MPASFFTLDVTIDPAARRATLRLAGGDGRHLATHEVDLTAHPAQWAAAFDTRGHVRRMARLAPAEGLGDMGPAYHRQPAQELVVERDGIACLLEASGAATGAVDAGMHVRRMHPPAGFRAGLALPPAACQGGRA